MSRFDANLEKLLGDLFHVHGLIDEAELLAALQRMAASCSASGEASPASVEVALVRYRSLLSNWLDPTGKPVPFATFREGMLEVLSLLEPNSAMHGEMLARFADAAWEGAGEPDESLNDPEESKQAPESARCLEDLLQELFRLQDLNGDGLLEEAELVQLNKKSALLHFGQDADLEAVAVRFKSVFRFGLSAKGEPVPYETFRGYMTSVLRSQDKDVSAQEIMMEHFVLEATAARAAFSIPSFHSDSDDAIFGNRASNEGPVGPRPKAKVPFGRVAEAAEHPESVVVSVVGDLQKGNAHAADELVEPLAFDIGDIDISLLGVLLDGITGFPLPDDMSGLDVPHLAPTTIAEPCADVVAERPAETPGPPDVPEEPPLEDLLKELYVARGTLTQLELNRMIEVVVASQRLGASEDPLEAQLHYRSALQAWLEATEPPLPCDSFRRVTTDVLNILEPDKTRQRELLQRFLQQAGGAHAQEAPANERRARSQDGARACGAREEEPRVRACSLPVARSQLGGCGSSAPSSGERHGGAEPAKAGDRGRVQTPLPSRPSSGLHALGRDRARAISPQPLRRMFREKKVDLEWSEWVPWQAAREDSDSVTTAASTSV